MSKYTKTSVTQLSANEQAAIDQINKNFDDIQSAIADSVSRSGAIPSHMTNDLDMNGKRIINVPAPTVDTDLVRRKDVVGDIASVQAMVNTTTNAAAQTLAAAQAVQEILENEQLGIVADDLALGDNSKIKITADNIDDVNTIANNIEDINSVASNITNVNSVADNETNINAVNSNKTNIDIVAGIDEDVTTVAGISGDVTTVAGISSDVEAVADNETNINNCSTNMSAITDAPTQASNAASSASDAALSAQQAAISAAGTKFKLFHHEWFDYQLNDMAWLRADTFSWQNGTVYSDAYNHLVDDYNNGEKLYGWGDFSYWVGTTSATPSVGDSVYAGVPSAAVGTVESVGSGSITVGGTTYSRYSDVDGGFFDSVGSYVIRYVKAQDSHKITTDESTVLDIYNESGVAWYYVLDTANTRFKLPRENPAREELLQIIRAKGNGKALGLDDGSAPIGLYTVTSGLAASRENYYSNVGSSSSGSSYSNNKVVGLSYDSTKSGIISSMTDSTSVYKGKKYLYFYVGQFTQTATEQTAGLHTELFTGKIDLNLNNMNPSASSKQTILRWGIPDYSTAVTLTTPNQNWETFTATYDCFVLLNLWSMSSVASEIYINGVQYYLGSTTTSQGQTPHSVSLFLKRGDVLQYRAGYNNNGTATNLAKCFKLIGG